MRRSAVSITSNIAEGYGRYSKKDKNQFFLISIGSNFELQNQITIAKDVGYISLDKFIKMDKELIEVSKMTFGLIKN